MSLKNLTRERVTRNGSPSWLLRANEGLEVEAFSRFSEFAHRYGPRTTKRYLEVVGRFLDYLYEAGVFASTPLSTLRLNAIVDAYPLLLRDGSELTARRVLESVASGHEDQWLARTATALGWAPIRSASFSNTLAAINHFLSLSDSLAREELERANVLGIAHNGSPAGLIKSLRGDVKVTRAELHRMRQNSMLGSVAKFAEKGLRRPRRMRTDATGAQEENQSKDFPLEYLPALIGAASSWRDKALWLLLAASGIRTSEARNLLLDDVVPEEQRIYVIDPSGRRFAPSRQILEQPRFKGRTVAATYLFPPLRQQFFHALERYLSLEYVPTAQPGQPRYLFQYSEPSKRGQPLVKASDSALAKSFKKACHDAGVPLTFDGRQYTPHSLRHLYGVYLLNDYPVDPHAGRYGLPITDVQMLMGHAKLSTTQKYARVKRERLMRRLQTSDQALLHLSPEELKMLPNSVVHSWTTLND